MDIDTTSQKWQVVFLYPFLGNCAGAKSVILNNSELSVKQQSALGIPKCHFYTFSSADQT